MPTIQLPFAVYERLVTRAVAEDTTISALVEQALADLPPLSPKRERVLQQLPRHANIDPRCACCPTGCTALFYWRGHSRCGCVARDAAAAQGAP